MLDLINLARSRNGLKPLSLNARLCLVAKAHAEDEKRRGYYSHCTPEGLGPSDRVNRARIPCRGVGENLCGGPTRGGTTGYASIQQAHAALVRSPRHKDNLLGPYDEVGIGVTNNADGTFIVVELFLIT